LRSKLLEHVGQRIINRCFKELPSIARIKLGVSKLNPPIGGDVEAVTIEMEAFRS
jgi:dihydroneopterin aldolase